MIRILTISAVALAAVGAALADDAGLADGKALFEQEWAAEEGAAASGLGPLFNARACNSCHKEGGASRFFTVAGELIARGLVVKLARPEGGPHPSLGTQLQDRAVEGLQAEGKIKASLAGDALKVEAAFADATVKDIVTEARIAPSLRGRGLLEEVDERAIVALADPNDRDGDGISGRLRYVDGPDGRRVPGRFGYKAHTASLEMQTADAAAVDIGLSSTLRPRPQGDCTGEQRECLAKAAGEAEEISQQAVSQIAGFVRSLERTSRVTAGPGVDVFGAIGCAGCHRPAMPDRAGKPLPVFTDLLLHDLGSDVAGTIQDGKFSPSEWRTAPLIDLDAMDGKRRYLHDGRAATIDQAIRLHGGEAQKSREAFERLSRDDKQTLIDFLSRL
jgi:CxxC motif-containing protein (DUF1111 family)